MAVSSKVTATEVAAAQEVVVDAPPLVVLVDVDVDVEVEV